MPTCSTACSEPSSSARALASSPDRGTISNVSGSGFARKPCVNSGWRLAIRLKPSSLETNANVFTFELDAIRSRTACISARVAARPVTIGDAKKTWTTQPRGEASVARTSGGFEPPQPVSAAAATTPAAAARLN